jgi:hypothetical protein
MSAVIRDFRIECTATVLHDLFQIGYRDVRRGPPQSHRLWSDAMAIGILLALFIPWEGATGGDDQSGKWACTHG